MQVKRNPPLLRLTIQIKQRERAGWTVNKKLFERSPVSTRLNRVTPKQVESCMCVWFFFRRLLEVVLRFKKFQSRWDCFFFSLFFHKALVGSKQIDSGNSMLWCNWFQCTESNNNNNRRRKTYKYKTILRMKMYRELRRNRFQHFYSGNEVSFYQYGGFKCHSQTEQISANIRISLSSKLLVIFIYRKCSHDH